MNTMARFIFTIIWLVAYVFLGAFFENTGTIVEPAYFSLYGLIMASIYMLTFNAIDNIEW